MIGLKDKKNERCLCYRKMGRNKWRHLLHMMHVEIATVAKSKNPTILNTQEGVYNVVMKSAVTHVQKKQNRKSQSTKHILDTS
ncbi:hypothetical protein WA026_007957 [Henosepilachna vigintioctopunctata]|uniref:Uncharacterized protein n=1 Tax=Henosepilachna vigintioctopunctata TaxID=420089 RepID=A0AAW1TRI9_9CUCU